MCCLTQWATVRLLTLACARRTWSQGALQAPSVGHQITFLQRYVRAYIGACSRIDMITAIQCYSHVYVFSATYIHVCRVYYCCGNYTQWLQCYSLDLCCVCVCAHVVIPTVHTVDKVCSFYMFTLLIHTFQQSTSTVLMYVHAHLQDVSAREPLSTAYRVLQ